MNNATIIENKKPMIALDILTTKGMQLREGTNGKTVTQYCERYKEGADLEPIVVFVDQAAGHTYLVDGHHRVAAAKRAGLNALPVIIHVGDRRAALLFAATANAKHGLPLTNEDKRRIVDVLLADDEWRTWSDRAIADTVHVSPHLVASRRKKLPKELQSDARKTKSGKIIDTKNIGKPKPQKPITDHDPIVVLDDKEPEEIKLDQPPAPEPKKKTPPPATAISVDDKRSTNLRDAMRRALADELETGKQQFNGHEKHLVSIALVVGVPVAGDDPAWSEELCVKAYSILSDRVKIEIIDSLRRPDAHRLPPIELLCGWYGIDHRAISMTAERKTK